MRDRNETRFAPSTTPHIASAQSGGAADSRKRVDPTEGLPIARPADPVGLSAFIVGAGHFKARPRPNLYPAFPGPFPYGLRVLDRPWMSRGVPGQEGWNGDNETLI
jgi:hypothetical protein